ncbi:MAG: hypothetical protein ABIO71_12935 [Caldimonas sp.]
MYARLSAFVIWSLVAATAVFWALRFSARPLPAPPYAVAVGKAAPIRGDLTRLFGAAPIVAVAAEAEPAAPNRFRLVGVMAPRASRADAPAAYGLALIAVDGKPAKAFAVGSRLDNELVLQSVSLRTASIGPAQGARSVLLELPALTAPATGVLPAPGAVTAAAPVPATAMRAVPAPAAIAPMPSPLPPIPSQPVPAAPVPGLPSGAVPLPGAGSPDNFRSQ